MTKCNVVKFGDKVHFDYYEEKEHINHYAGEGYVKDIEWMPCEIRQELAQSPVQEEDSFLDEHTAFNSGLPYRKKLEEVQKMVKRGLREFAKE